MPTPKAGESQKDYISRCIPIVIREGTAKDSSQAAAICHSMWKEHAKQKSVERKHGGHPDQSVHDPRGGKRDLGAGPESTPKDWSKSGDDYVIENPDEERRASASVKKTQRGEEVVVIELDTGEKINAVDWDEAFQIGQEYVETGEIGEEGIEERPETPGLELGVGRYSDLGISIAQALGIGKERRKDMNEQLSDMQYEERLKERLLKQFSTEDPGLFTACMDDPDNQKRYPDEERRARVCASIHKKITGIYPAEHESKSLKERIPSAIESIFGGALDLKAEYPFSLKDIDNAAEHLRIAIELHQAHLDGSEPIDEESQEALMVHLRAALDELGEEIRPEPQGIEESEKGEEHPWHRGRPGEIGGSTSSGAGGGGGESAYRGGDEAEWRMVNRRLAAGNLKRGERALLERRAEKLAMKILGVKESRSFKEKIVDLVMSIFGIGKPKEERSALDAGAVDAIFKQADGRWRWTLLSSNGFEDSDREIVSTKALEDDVRHSDATREYGPLLWWHVPGAELGRCDFRAVHGHTLVESGLFHLAEVGQKIKESSPRLKASLGFFHPLSEPDGDGAFNVIRTFERSLLPADKAANQLTALPVITRKESSMEQKKMDALKELLGDDLTAQVVKKADEQEKSAQDAGVRFKEQKKVKQDEMPAEEAEPAAEEVAGETPTTEEVVRIVTDAVTPIAEAVMATADAVEIVAAEVGVEEEVMNVIESTMTEEAKAARKKRRDEWYAKRGKALGKLSEATKRLEAAETEIKRLTGKLPKAVKTGFRASESPATVIEDEKTKALTPPPEVAAFSEFYSNLVQGQRK